MRLLVAGVVLLALLVAGDRGAEQLAEGVLAGELEGELGARPDVEIDGFPFLTQALRGRYDRLQVTADRVDRAGVPVLDVAATLSGVQVPLSDAVSGAVDSVPVQGLRVRGLVTYDALERLAGDRGIELAAEGAEVRVSGTVRVLGDEVPASALSSLRLEGDTVVLTARTLEVGGAEPTGQVAGALSGRLDVAVPLPALPYGVRLSAVESGPDGVTVTGTAPAATVLQP